MAKAVGSASARFRQRKISVKQKLQIFYQSEIPDIEDEQQRELQQIETGVEKGEEEEHHLQAAINASNAATSGAKVEQVYIPTPDASKKWASADYDKYYPRNFVEPATYIRFSATVEDTSGCPYNMDEEDEKFLAEYNKSRSGDEVCTEDEFELVCHKFEAMIEDSQPFITMDPSQLMSYEDMADKIVEQMVDAEKDPSNPEFLLSRVSTPLYLSSVTNPAVANSERAKSKRNTIESFKKFSKDLYQHWRRRKLEREGKSVFPILKFEDGEKDDSDPYVCFRRRELRQVRKTRRADQQSSERLWKLKAEMEQARKLMEMVVRREQMRKEALELERDIFEERCSVKTLKRSLGIKGDDEDLVAHKRKKVDEPRLFEKKTLTSDKKSTPSSAAPATVRAGTGSANAIATAAVGAAGAANGQQKPVSNAPIHQVPATVRLPASKIPDMELLTLEQVLRDKEVAIRGAVKNKLKTRAQADREWVNYTDNPFVPYCDYFDPDVEERNNLRVIDPSHAAYSSIAAPYPPSSEVPLKLPLAASLGSSYSSRVEASPTVIRTNVDDATGDLTVVSRIGEKDMAPSGSFNVPRSSSMSLRRRYGRGGRIMVDRRGLVRHNKAIVEDDGMAQLYDRYKYDSDMHGDNMEFSSNDPSRLNGISTDTQAIRFGSMLLSKSYDGYREAYQLRQQHILQLQQRMLAQRQLQQQQHQHQQQQQLQQPPPAVHQQPADKSSKPKKTATAPGRPNSTPKALPAANGEIVAKNLKLNNTTATTATTTTNNTTKLSTVNSGSNFAPNGGGGASTPGGMKMSATPPTRVEG